MHIASGRKAVAGGWVGEEDYDDEDEVYDGQKTQVGGVSQRI